MEHLEPDHYPACLTVDLGAIRQNVAALKRHAKGTPLLAVVKSNGYGFGRTEVAFAAYDEGVRWFAVSRIPEALALRRDFDGAHLDPEDTHILTWIGAPDQDWIAAHNAHLDVSVSTVGQLEQAVLAAHQVAEASGEPLRPARIHLNVDVGMSRGGATEVELPELAARAKQAQDAGEVQVVGLLAHLPEADDPYGPGKAVTDSHIARFRDYRESVLAAGLTPQVCHLGATAGTIWHPDAHFDMVRPGIGIYGFSPNPSVATSSDLGLIPAGRFTTTVTQIKLVEPGTRVSYGGTWVASEPTWIGLLPVGYADGIPRSISNRVSVQVRTGAGVVNAPIIGRVCMDQIMIDLGTDPETPAQVGDTVVLFGDPSKGETAVDDWARVSETIHYEVLSRLPEHIVRVYVDAPEEIDYEFLSANDGGGA